MTVIVVCMS